MSNELKMLKLEALKAMLEAANNCMFAYKQFEDSDPDYMDVTESIWTSEEDMHRGMRKLYEAMFNEKAPLTRNELKEAIIELSYSF